MRKLLALTLLLFPWRLRRLLLQAFFGYKIHQTARIGLSLILPDRLEMDAHSTIGSLTVCHGASLLKMGENSSIGNMNWITGYPLQGKAFYQDDPDRRPELILERHAAITNRHLLDCTNVLHIGQFATFAGWGSQVLTHSIDLVRSRQASHPVSIGAYTFVGAGCIILGGSVLPDYSILGAGSVLAKAYIEAYTLYAGTPARAVKALPKTMKYFSRDAGFVQ